MAHTCPKCAQLCHCNGDIDDICFGEDQLCCHCEDEDEEEFPEEYDEETGTWHY